MPRGETKYPQDHFVMLIDETYSETWYAIASVLIPPGTIGFFRRDLAANGQISFHSSEEWWKRGPHSIREAFSQRIAAIIKTAAHVGIWHTDCAREECRQDLLDALGQRYKVQSNNLTISLDTRREAGVNGNRHLDETDKETLRLHIDHVRHGSDSRPHHTDATLAWDSALSAPDVVAYVWRKATGPEPTAGKAREKWLVAQELWQQLEPHTELIKCPHDTQKNEGAMPDHGNPAAPHSARDTQSERHK